jgi:hypothetical protein
MDILTEGQVRRLFEVTDGFRLDRDQVVVPLAGREKGMEMVLPDGKLLVGAPGGAAFEPWLAGLKARLERLDLSRTPRAPGVKETVTPSPPVVK